MRPRPLVPESARWRDIWKASRPNEEVSAVRTEVLQARVEHHSQDQQLLRRLLSHCAGDRAKIDVRIYTSEVNIDELVTEENLKLQSIQGRTSTLLCFLVERSQWNGSKKRRSESAPNMTPYFKKIEKILALPHSKEVNAGEVPTERSSLFDAVNQTEERNPLVAATNYYAISSLCTLCLSQSLRVRTFYPGRMTSETLLKTTSNALHETIRFVEISYDTKAAQVSNFRFMCKENKSNIRGQDGSA